MLQQVELNSYKEMRKNKAIVTLIPKVKKSRKTIPSTLTSARRKKKKSISIISDDSQ